MLATIGYERASVEEFVGTLKAARVSLVADVRDRAQSRRNGFSKTSLSQRLQTEGIHYIHLRELGDPKEGRIAARSGEMAKFKRIYSRVIRTPEAKRALDKIVELMDTYNVCLMCYERNHTDCHRTIISYCITEMTEIDVVHLWVREIDSVGQPGRRMLHPREGAAAQV